jgi:hypothetical protein
MRTPENTTHFLVHKSGEMEPVAPTDIRISRWDWEKQEYQYLSALSVKVYDKDLKVSDLYQVPRHIEKKIGKRGCIKKYSFGASRRCKFFMRNTGHLMKVMITLTYPKDYPMDGATVKAHLHKFLLWLTYHGYKYIWILEFQERGAPHFHILVDKEIPHQKVAGSWYRIVGSGDEKHLKAGTEVRAIRAKDSIGYYLTTYMEKARQKSVPPEYEKVGRFWGSSKGLLQEKKMNIFGKREDIYKLKKSLRIARRYDQSQKKQWEKRAKAKGKKRNKFKKYYSKAYSLHIINSDKMKDELSKHGIDLFPYTLADVPPVPDSRERRGGRMTPEVSKTQEINSLKPTKTG